MRNNVESGICGKSGVDRAVWGIAESGVGRAVCGITVYAESGVNRAMCGRAVLYAESVVSMYSCV